LALVVGPTSESSRVEDVPFKAVVVLLEFALLFAACNVIPPLPLLVVREIPPRPMEDAAAQISSASNSSNETNGEDWKKME
jgi:hypothetical protein